MLKCPNERDVRLIERVTGLLERGLQGLERNYLVGLRREHAKTLFDVCKLNLFQLRCEVQTAHGLLNVVDSIAAEVARDVHLHTLDFSPGTRGAPKEQDQAHQRQDEISSHLSYSLVEQKIISALTSLSF